MTDEKKKNKKDMKEKKDGKDAKKIDDDLLKDVAGGRGVIVGLEYQHDSAVHWRE